MGCFEREEEAIFKYVRDEVVTSEIWTVLVEEENGESKVISRFKIRPSIAEVESVLYNLVQSNWSITKSARFSRDLVSNVRGKMLVKTTLV